MVSDQSSVAVLHNSIPNNTPLRRNYICENDRVRLLMDYKGTLNYSKGTSYPHYTSMYITHACTLHIHIPSSGTI